MSDTDPKPDAGINNLLHGSVHEAGAFQAPPMQAPSGQSPESLLGKRLALARGHFGLSVEALSRLTKLYDEGEQRGISPPSIARYESGESSPGVREVRLLCDALGLLAQWLIYGDTGTAGESNEGQALLMALDAYLIKRSASLTDSIGSSQAQVQWEKHNLRVRRILEARKSDLSGSVKSTKTG